MVTAVVSDRRHFRNRLGCGDRAGRYGLPALRIQSAQQEIALDDDVVIFGDNASVLERLPEETFDLIHWERT